MPGAVKTARAVAAVIAAVVLTSCSGGGSIPRAVTTPTCTLFTRMAEAGKAVASADVSDPDKFDAALRRAVNDYVRATRRLRRAVPFPLRADVDQLTAAAEQYRFADAKTARAHIESYARSKCKTGS